MANDKSKNVRGVPLPGPKVAEIVTYIEAATPAIGERVDGPRQPCAPDPAAGGRQNLHTCPRCARDLVYPLDWAPAGSSHWRVTLRCPECEWGDSGLFAEELIERFDAELDRGAEKLLRDLQHLAHANMADDVERFVAALRAGHIIADDFV